MARAVIKRMGLSDAEAGENGGLRMFQQERKGRLTVFQSPLLQKERDLLHGFSSRGGGYSQGCYAGLNLGLTSGDQVVTVQQNRQLFAAVLGISPEQVVCGHQVHSANIAHVGKGDMGRGFLDARQALPETDGLVTNERGIALMTLYADCVPVLFYEPVQRVIAVCHCGWKGTVQKIAANMAQVMVDSYGCDVRQIRAAIGPSISQDAYEVDQPVLERFRQAFSFAEQLIVPTDGEHGKLDLWEANRLQLLEAGLQENHIDVSGLCTFQKSQTFFSHRADQGKTGRNGALLMMA